MSLLGLRLSTVILQPQGCPRSWAPCLAAQGWTWQPLPPFASQACRAVVPSSVTAPWCSALLPVGDALLCHPYFIFQGSFQGLLFSKKPSLILLDRMRGVSSVFLRYPVYIPYSFVHVCMLMCAQHPEQYPARSRYSTDHLWNAVWIALSCSHDASMCPSPHD